MGCCCLASLAAALKALAGLPLNLLANMIDLPFDLPLLSLATNSMAGLGFSAGLSASFAASLSAKLSMALALNLPPFPLPLPSLNLMESLALAGQVGGFSLKSPSAAFDLAFGSMNLHLKLLPMLLDLLMPLADLLADLLALASPICAMKMMGLTVSGGAWKPMLMANLNLMAQFRATLSANLALLANLALWGRMANAALALGFNLSAPGGLFHFTAGLNFLCSLRLPPLNLSLSPSMMAQLAGLLAALAQVRMAFGINLLLPNAWDLLKAALAALLPDLKLSLTAAEALALTENASLAASLAAISPAFNPHLSLMAKFNFALPLPSLGSLGLVANIAQQLDLAGLGIFSPPGSCTGCPF